MTTLRIPARFNGPPDSGNGGYVAGMLAATRDEPVVRIMLRTPPPLETPLRVADGNLLHGEQVVATSAPAGFEHEPPPPVAPELAAAVSGAHNGGEVFGHCFVCGSLRTDGLGIQAGPVGSGVVAAPWSPDGTVAIDTPLLWAVMDCPGGWAVPGMFDRPALLGSMTATLLDLPAPAEECVVVGALHAQDGRKIRTATALYGSDDRLISRSEQVWIRLAG
ncbi:hypothetical protein [Nocardia stercoris]|uniref:Thioesterase family protein n=1 Tax=Nocardia stercoris TaxID=2483361 RepID=A0A3M2LI31_9NOCA|nr:hypothetical protein [Nocardia stercoris]RMI34428.1 hypothetical protein EBN03_06715 [Nocardia stercoris]